MHPKEIKVVKSLIIFFSAAEIETVVFGISQHGYFYEWVSLMLVPCWTASEHICNKQMCSIHVQNEQLFHFRVAVAMASEMSLCSEASPLQDFM